jgi:HK97 family phage major capsid protein
LFTLSLPLGTAGSALPLYQFSDDPDAMPYGTLCGRPVLLSEYASAVGSAGDLCLIDPSQIVTVDKGEPQQDIRMDVKFLTDEGIFRVVYRVDGAPSWHTALTPYNDSTTVSPYVVLGAR